MTTTDEALDLLDRLGNPDLAEKAELLASRPQDRFPATYFRADVPAQTPEVISRRPGNSQFDQWGFFLEVNITEVYESKTPIETGPHTLWIRTAKPSTDKGGDNTFTLRTEYVQMNRASGISSVKALLGQKGVVFHEEEPFTYSYRRNTNRPDPMKPGSTIWEDAEGQVWFYKVTLNATSNGSSPAPAAEVTPELVELALGIIKNAGEAGIPDKEFQLAASKVALLKPLWGQIADGKFVTAQLKSGKVSQTAEGNLVVA